MQSIEESAKEYISESNIIQEYLDKLKLLLQRTKSQKERINLEKRIMLLESEQREMKIVGEHYLGQN